MPVETLTDQRQPLDDHQDLWRYMKLSTLLLLLEGKAFFPSVATLQKGDPWEGLEHFDERYLVASLRGNKDAAAASKLNEWLLEQSGEQARHYVEINKDHPDARNGVLAQAYIEELAKRRAVWCWFAADLESAGMWTAYGHNGVAVRTTVRALRGALPDARTFQIARIRYADQRPCALDRFNPRATDSEAFLHRPHLIKIREFEHEHEVRVVTRCEGWREPGALVENIDWKQLILEVVISPLLPKPEAKTVESLIQKQPWKDHPRVRRSNLLTERERRESGFLDAVFDGLSEYDTLPALMKEL